MHTSKRIAVIIMGICWIFSLFGCGKRHLRDGDGMERQIPWKEFVFSQNSDVYEENFCYTVVKGDDGSDFYLYVAEGGVDPEEGIPLKPTTVNGILSLNLHDLPDREPVEETDGVFLLDGNAVYLRITDESGICHDKALSEGVADKLLAILARCDKAGT
jgi:hypothetical protein